MTVDENYESIMTFYKNLAKHENYQIRKNFIYNLPGVLLITNTTDFEEFHKIYL